MTAVKSPISTTNIVPFYTETFIDAGTAYYGYLAAAGLSDLQGDQLSDLCLNRDIVFITETSQGMNQKETAHSPTHYSAAHDIAQKVANVATLFSPGNDLSVRFSNGLEYNELTTARELADSYAKTAPTDKTSPVGAIIEKCVNEIQADDELKATLVISTDGGWNGAEEINTPAGFETFLQKRQGNADLCERTKLVFILFTKQQATLDRFTGYSKNFTNVTVLRSLETMQKADGTLSEQAYIIRALGVSNLNS